MSVLVGQLLNVRIENPKLEMSEQLPPIHYKDTKFFVPIDPETFTTRLKKEDLDEPEEVEVTYGYVRNWQQTSAKDTKELVKFDIGCTVTVGVDDFEVLMDVDDFRNPEQLIVNQTGAHIFTIEGTSANIQETNGLVSRSFKKTFYVPLAYNMTALSCKLSIDGVLMIRVPRTKDEEGKVENKTITWSVDPLKPSVLDAIQGIRRDYRKRI